MFATIYTDASHNKDLYGYSYYTRCNKGVFSGSGIISPEDCPDINYAEMYCIVKAIKESSAKFKNISRILIVTDSINAQYTLWDGHEQYLGKSLGSKSIKYSSVVEEFKVLENNFEKIMIKWTKGHRIDNSDRAYLNNKCDERASAAIKNYNRPK